MIEKIEYAELDANMRELVKVLNSFPGIIRTLESCGGHPFPEPGQYNEGRWYVLLDLARNESGWQVVELIAWLRARFGPNSLAFDPVDSPGVSLHFLLDGHQVDPEELAREIQKYRQERRQPVEKAIPNARVEYRGKDPKTG